MRLLNALPQLALAATLLLQTAHAQAPQIIQLKVVSGLPLVDGVYLNGQGPFRFLLDTGQETNQMDQKLARRLGLTPTLQVELKTSGGVSHAVGTTVDQIALGTLTAEKMEFLFTTRDSLHQIASDVDGILGQQFLGRFDYLLDMRHRRLVVGVAAPAGIRVGFRRVHGCMLIPTSAGELMLDSGTSTLFLFRQAMGQINRIVATSNSDITVTMDRAPTLSIGGAAFRPDTAAYYPAPKAPADGLLPANLFQAVYVSNSGGFAILNPELDEGVGGALEMRERIAMKK